MSAWEPETLTAIAGTDDLHVAPFREDGVTTGTPTWIWSVVVDGDLYVRAWNGTSSRWYTAAMREHGGQIHAAGRVIDVHFAAADPALADNIDRAYSEKYAGSQYLPPMIGPRTRRATVRITPATDEAS